MLVSILVVTVLFALVLLPILPVISGRLNDSKKAKRRVCINLSAFGLIMLIGILVPVFTFAAAEGDAAAATEVAGITNGAFTALAAALAVGLAGLGGGLAVGPAASAAIGAMAEDPSTFGKSLIFVALGEGIAIYGLLVAFLILFVI